MLMDSLIVMEFHYIFEQFKLLSKVFKISQSTYIFFCFYFLKQYMGK